MHSSSGPLTIAIKPQCRPRLNATSM